jgi:hypothetical protein
MGTIEEFDATILFATVLPVKWQQLLANLLNSNWRCLTRSLSTRLNNPLAATSGAHRKRRSLRCRNPP